MLSFPVMDQQELFGVNNVNGTTMKMCSEDRIYFVSIHVNLILSAVRLRKRIATSDLGAA